jgi:nucleotide-binding universal stress UspA family protein
VVVAVDGSNQSVAAAELAATFARGSTTRLTVVTVVRPPEGWWGIEGAPPSAAAFAEAVMEGSNRLHDLIADIDTGNATIDTVEEVGDPATKILEVVDRTGADLLVIGRRGAGLVERMMMGSVADRLAHDAPCPVLVVP